jgi:hypothetical protein
MARRVPPGRLDERDQVASPELSRLLILGFVIAAILGLASGLVWMYWKAIS